MNHFDRYALHYLYILCKLVGKGSTCKAKD